MHANSIFKPLNMIHDQWLNYPPMPLWYWDMLESLFCLEVLIIYTNFQVNKYGGDAWRMTGF